MPLDEAKISEAVARCLKACRDKEPSEIFPVIREFMKSLASAGNWTTNELRAFEAAVNRTLIIGPSRGAVYSGNATRAPGGNPATPLEAGITTV